MAKQIINLGQTANDRTGDPLRLAFEKVNANFDELYTATTEFITETSELVNGSSVVSLASNGILSLPNTGTILNTGTATIGASYTFTSGFNGSTEDLVDDISLRLESTTDSQQIETGWIVQFANGQEKTLVNSAAAFPDGWDITWSGLVSYVSADVWPLTISSPDYVAGSTFALALSPDGTTTWTFDGNGGLTLPNGATQHGTSSVTCQPGVDTVVFTSSQAGIQTIKLLLQVEGQVTAPDDADTQSCEMIIAKGFRGPTVSASVYGIVYTSVAPLATFTADWNALSSRVEVTCQPASLTNSVAVKAFATEITTSD